jgi:uncharacterized membrane protein YoaT (DUF817 family)
MNLRVLDAALLHPPMLPGLSGARRFLVELIWFGIKEARSCLFAGLIFTAILLVPREGIWLLPRYDALLLIALIIQAWLLRSGLESVDEAKAIGLFHLIGFALEAYKVSPAIGSWSYPDPAWTKVLGVPLFAGFMYAAVGSYIIQAWRLLDVRIRHHPPYWLATLIALLIYANFFTHHYIGDWRWYIAACALGLYARTTVIFRPYDRDRRMPMLLAFALIGFFIWLAENFGKWSSWSLLVVMTFTIVAHLKHIKQCIHVPD